jgi:hypothetical protein
MGVVVGLSMCKLAGEYAHTGVLANSFEAKQNPIGMSKHAIPDCHGWVHARLQPIAEGSAGEAMVQEPTRPEVILKVDADQSTSRATK